MIISRYLAKEVLKVLSALVLILLLAFLSQQLVRYLNFVAVGKIPANLLFKLLLFEIPVLLTLLLPLSLYLSILLAYGRLYADNEMSILQMSGFGNRKLMRFTLSSTLIVSLSVLLLTTWIDPLISAQKQKMMSGDAATLHLIETLVPGRFRASPDGRHVLYVEALSRDHQRAQNVFLAQEKASVQPDSSAAWSLVVADEGYQDQGHQVQDQFFVIKNGYRYEGIPGQKDFKITQFKKYDIRMPAAQVKVNELEDDALATSDLWRTFQQPSRAAELQWRLSIPIATFLLALLAVPLSSVQPRKGRYLVIFPAILIYIIYINLLFAARRWVEQQKLPILFGMWWVHGLMILLIVAVFMTSNRTNKRNRFIS